MRNEVNEQYRQDRRDRYRNMSEPDREQYRQDQRNRYEAMTGPDKEHYRRDQRNFELTTLLINDDY